MKIRKVKIKNNLLLPESASKGYEDLRGKDTYVDLGTCMMNRAGQRVVAQCYESGEQTGQMILVKDIVGEEEALK